jgi:cobalt-zinc-cadmium efflux system protein
MAILADCIHDMSDTFSMAIAWILEHVAQKGATDKFSYGYQRFSILGAVITSSFVSVMAFFILSEAIPRLFSPEGVDAEGMLIIGIIGLVFKTISVWRLHGGETFNEEAVFYHLLGDIFEILTIKATCFDAHKDIIQFNLAYILRFIDTRYCCNFSIHSFYFI